MLPSQPPSPQTQWQMGAYTIVSHIAMNQSTALNFILSANAPTISAGVMIANVIWNVMKTVSGMVPLRESTVTPDRNILSSPPQ